MMNPHSKSSRMVDSGYAANKPYPKKKAAPAAKKSPVKAPAAKKAFKKAEAPKVSSKPATKSVKPIGRFGRDTFTPAPRAAKSVANRPGINRQEVEAGVMSNMYRNRLGPGQR